MPGGDRTGPMGAGPMTGRNVGFCAGHGMPGYANPVGGRGRGFWGWGCGRGGGWGRRFGFGAGQFNGAPMGAGYPAQGPTAPVTPTREQELETLKQQASYFQGALEDIQKRIDALQSDESSK